ncbi:DUF397 domain-containing protein [Actinomadura sp. 21ATH]|uniref:DUF397 domain-containing protein n=1 Tax=Actinomadura sp. 21ATH TaxID=1735444 RepID=UPI0035C06F09
MDLAGANWRKSSHGETIIANCIEVADLSALLAVREDNTAWRRASRSGENGGDCVELASAGGVVGVHDSKDPNGPVLLVTPSVLRAAVQATAAHPTA